MTPHKKRSCPITRRLAEDMIIRNLAPATIDAYTYHVRRFADFIQKPLDQVTREDVRTFQLHLIEERKLAYSTFNQAVCALRFYYRHTQPMPWPVTAVPFGKRPKKLPTVLSRQDVDALIQCTSNLKHRTFLMTLYACGMRFSEAANLRIPDIDSNRMMIRIASGKGSKERFVPLSPRLLKALRVYWINYKPTDLLFPGKPRTKSSEDATKSSEDATKSSEDATKSSGDATKPYADTTIRKAMKVAAEKAGIRRRVFPHVLRHSYATGLLEAGVDLLTISKLLGHASFITTMVYLHCRREHLHSAPSPLDWLPVKQLPTYVAPEEGPPEENSPQTS